MSDENKVKKKIVIVDAYHDSDKGGVGILWGMIYAIKESSKKLNMEEQVEIEIIYRFSEDDPRYKTANRHTSKKFPELRIYGSPYKTYAPYVKKSLSKHIFNIFHSFLVLCFPNISSNPAIEAIRNADIVISKGGHFYRSAPGFLNIIEMYGTIYSLLLCARLNKKYFIVSHTVGPLYYPSTYLLKYVFNKANFVSTREAISQKNLHEIGVKGVKVTPDTAFYLPPGNKKDVEPLLKKYGLKYKKFATIVARYWNFPHSGTETERAELYQNYISTLAMTADYLVQNYVEKVALVVHTMGQHDEFEEDNKPITAIYEKVENKSSVEIINEDLSPDMLSCLYHSARLMVGTRLHAVIFATVSGTPSIAIAYGHKTYGIMSMMGLEDQVVDINKIQYNDLTKLIDKLMEHEAENRENIFDTVKNLREEIEKITEIIIKEL